jgi:CheY-like chemotaxis protein
MASGGRVLVIDDDPASLRLARELLGAAGYDVRAAASVDEVVQVFTGSWIPELVVTDVRMPTASGPELCRLIRSRYRPARIPVVLYSMLPRTTLDEIARACDADAVISKGESLDTLTSELSTLWQHLVGPA